MIEILQLFWQSKNTKIQNANLLANYMLPNRKTTSSAKYLKWQYLALHEITQLLTVKDLPTFCT